MKKVFVFCLFLSVIHLAIIQPVEAVVSFTLSAPTPAPPLSSGDTVSFDLIVNTGGESVTSQSIGMRYRTEYLSFTSFTPGTIFSTVTTTTPANGDFVVNVSEPAGYTGNGVVGTATFSIIADTPGSTTLCSTFLPTATPTPPASVPTTPVGQPTCIPMPAGGTNSQYPNPPYCLVTPGELPMSGNTSQIGLIGGIIFMITLGISILSKKKIHSFLLFFFLLSLFLSLSSSPVNAEELYRNYRIDISPVPCAGVGGCPNDFINNPTIWQNYPHDRGLTHECAATIDQFKTDPTRYHYWVEDPDITEQGKADERARQFLYWVLNTTAIDNHPTIRNIWFFSSTMAYVFVVIVAAIFGIGYIISKRTNFALHIEIRPTLMKIGTMLLYIAFSYALLLFLIQLSEIMMKFFIDNLGGDKLFNIYFAGATSSEENYKTFVGCRDINIRVQESANAELFLLKLTNVSYYIMGTMILLRKILLWFLIFVSPFLAILMPFILIRNTGWIWIGVFFQWLFYGPLLALFLGATAQMWANGIPFSFDFSKVQQASGYIYPTAIIITYGGPAQIAAKQIGAFNNGNYVDTFAEYVITLIMLWAVTFFPWWLLRIFRDYCCEGIYASRNILLAIYDQLRAPPPGTGPKGPPTMPKLRTELNVPTDSNVKVNVKLSSLDQIRQVNTSDISKTLNLNASRLTDIARMEINKTTKNTVINNIKLLSNPVKAQTPTERQQYMNLRTELFTRAVKNDSVARTILASTSSSRSEQVKQREHILKEIPVGAPIIRIISAQTNISSDKINTITQSYMQSVSKQNSVINNIAQSTQLPPAQVQNILHTYSQSMNQPMTNVVNHITSQTGTPSNKVIAVLQQAGAYTSQSSIIEQTATKEKIHKDHIGNILVALTNIVKGGPSIGQVISTQTKLPPEKTQSIINNLFSSVYNDAQSLQLIESQSQVNQEQIKQVLTSYTENVNQAPSRMVANIASKTGLEKEKVVNVIQNATTLIQESEVIKDIAKKNNYQVPMVLKVVENIQTIMASPSAPPINMPIIEKTALMSKLTPIQVQSIATSVVKQVVTDSTLVQEISTNNAVSPAQVTNILQSYITNISKPATEVVNSIASQNNISTNTVNNVLQETHELIKQSKSVRNIARREQVSTKAVNTVAKVIFATSKEKAADTPVTILTASTQVPGEQAVPIINSMANNFINNNNAVQLVSNQTGVSEEQVKQTITTYVSNLSTPTSSVINAISNTTHLTKDQASSVLNSFSTVVNSPEVVSNISKETKTSEKQVREVIQGVPNSVKTTVAQTATPIKILTQNNKSITQDQATQIVSSLATSVTNNTTALQTISNQTGTTVEQVKQTINEYSSSLGTASESVLNTISHNTGLTSAQTTNIINSFSTVSNAPEIISTIANETKTSQEQVSKVVQGIPSTVTTIVQQEQTTTPMTVLTQTTQTDSAQVMQVTNSLAQYVSQNSNLMQNIKNQTNVSEDKINNVLTSYNNNLTQDSETLISNISRDSNLSQSQVSQVVNSYANAITTDTTAIKQIANETNTTEEQVKEIIQTIPTTIYETALEDDKQAVVKVISYKSHIPEEKVRSVTNTIVNSIINNSDVMTNIQNETGLKAPQVTNILTTYAQNVNQPTEIITERIYQSAGIEKSKVTDVLRSVTENITSSKEIMSDVAQKEHLQESDVAKVISSQIPLATEPNNNIEQTIAIPPTTSIEDYEEVKNMWIKQYEAGEVPVTENIQSREEWLDQDTVFITNTLNKLLSPDEKLRQEGLDDLGYILPVFMINNLKGDELLVYLKAKLEAGKFVKKDLDKEKLIRAKVLDEQKADDEELVELKHPKAKEKEMTLENEQELEIPESADKEEPADETATTDENKITEEEGQENEPQDKEKEHEEDPSDPTQPAETDNSQLTNKDEDLLANIKKKLEENSK